MFGMFDGLFDFNHDGKLDAFEKAAEFATIMSILDDEDRNDDMEDEDFYDDDDDDLY